MDDARPLFLQIAEQIEGQIVDGSMREESQVPSINELAAFHRINPATALKGVNLLVEAGVLYKRRGVGMFVAPGAHDALIVSAAGGFPFAIRASARDRGEQIGDHATAIDPDDRKGGGTMTANIVEARGLTKRFGSVKAVTDATFSVTEGSICGLLGRNGSGKTTLMHLLTGQEFASQGAISLFGETPVENAGVLGRTCFIKETQTYPDGFTGQARAACRLVGLSSLGRGVGGPTRRGIRGASRPAHEAPVARTALRSRGRGRHRLACRAHDLRRALRGPRRGRSAHLLRPTPSGLREPPAHAS